MSVANDDLIYFFFLTGSNKGAIQKSGEKTVRIGRHPYCEVSLHEADQPASGEHALARTGQAPSGAGRSTPWGNRLVAGGRAGACTPCAAGPFLLRYNVALRGAP